MRYVTQRDPDGTWSVRERDTQRPAVQRDVAMIGLTEKLAVLNARRLNAWNVVPDTERGESTPRLNGRRFEPASAA